MPPERKTLEAREEATSERDGIDAHCPLHTSHTQLHDASPNVRGRTPRGFFWCHPHARHGRAQLTDYEVGPRPWHRELVMKAMFRTGPHFEHDGWYAAKAAQGAGEQTAQRVEPDRHLLGVQLGGKAEHVGQGRRCRR